VRERLRRLRRSREGLLRRERDGDLLRDLEREVNMRGLAGSTEEGRLTASRCDFRIPLLPDAIRSLSGLTMGCFE